MTLPTVIVIIIITTIGSRSSFFKRLFIYLFIILIFMYLSIILIFYFQCFLKFFQLFLHVLSHTLCILLLLSNGLFYRKYHGCFM